MSSSRNFIKVVFKNVFLTSQLTSKNLNYETTLAIQHRDIIAVSCKKYNVRYIFLNMPLECSVLNVNAWATFNN
jgi:hypothetical protein